jgi:LPS export ABC transporter protein LptC
MKITRKTALILAILATALIVTAVFMISLWKTPEKTLLKIMSDPVDLQVKDVHYTEVGDSGMKWEITADSARYRKKENLAIFEKVKVRLATKEGRVFTMNGDRGRLNTQSRDMALEGNVVIISEEGERISTDRLQYRNAERRIETDRPVVMQKGRSRITGVGMIFKLDEKRISLLSRVRASSNTR